MNSVLEDLLLVIWEIICMPWLNNLKRSELTMRRLGDQSFIKTYQRVLLEPRHFLFVWLDHELLHLSMKNRASLPPPSCSKAGLKYQKEKTLRTFSLKHDSQPYDSQTNTSLNNLFIFTNKYLIVIANSLAIHINLQFSDL